MKAELLAKFAAHAIDAIRAKDAVTDFNDIPELKAANDDYEAMMTPITAEALTAAGWEQASGDDMVYWTRAGGPVLECEFNIAGEATVTIDLPEALTAILFRGCRTMYDLRELVRLLGGQP